MKIGNIIHGFRLIKTTELPEIEGTFYEMVHEKTGAKLGWLKNEDENKTFSITFKTVPENSTGVFHILEHSVLQGSENYPVKAPFVELIKTSMNTFLNAITFPDKTMYPVSSRNEKDFENLIHVYMDAVLHPMLYKNENIFLQEGWHYEFPEEGEVPFYNGVVLNEMRGDSSSVDSGMFEALQAALFPENCYQYVSGGEPCHIPDLTYDAYKDTHRRFYHPSNSFILLHGKIDPERTLSILNDEFLCDFSKEDRCFDIPLQIGRGMVRSEKEYAVEEPGDHQGYLALGYVTGTYADVKKGYAAKILADYLTDSSEAPVKRAVLSSGLAYDINAEFSDGMLQSFLVLAIRNMEPQSRTEIEELVENTILSVKKEGLDKEQLEALLDQLEFGAKERSFGGYPEGLIDCITILNSWLYGGDPTIGLESGALFEELRKEIKDGSFEHYLDEFFLENNHRASVCMIPSESFLNEENEKEQERLENFWAGINEEEKEALRQKAKALKEWQKVLNTEEDCRCLPMLALSDISEEPLKLPLEIQEDGTLWHAAATKGIRYLRVYLPLEQMTEKEFSALSFLCGLIGELPLLEMDKLQLDMEKRRTFGNVSFDIIPEACGDDWRKAKAWFNVTVSCLKEKEEAAMQLLGRILKDTDWSNTDLIGELLRQQVDSCQQTMIMNGNYMAMLRAMSSSSEKAKINDLISGPSYADWIRSANDEYEADPSAFCQSLQKLAGKVLCTGKEKEEDLIVSMTSDGPKKGYKQEVMEILPENEGRESSKKSLKKTAFIGKEGSRSQEHSECSYISIPAPVSYSAKAGNINAFDIPNTGSWLVFSKLATMDYLWNRIRVQGGAYGTGMIVSSDGAICLTSYRDPNPEKSLETYLGLPGYMKEFCSGEHDLTGIIIGTIAETEPLIGAARVGGMSDKMYLEGITDAKRKERRGQILHTTREELAKLAGYLEQAVGKLDSCIVTKQER